MLRPRNRGVELIGITCRWCYTGFAMCRSCFRGHAYCCDECRRKARREQCRRANKKYLDHRDGRLQAAAMASAYRQRLQSGVARKRHPKIVIDQGSIPTSFSAEIAHELTHCARCGRRGRVVRWLQPVSRT